jgi:hypothetical protein
VCDDDNDDENVDEDVDEEEDDVAEYILSAMRPEEAFRSATR